MVVECTFQHLKVHWWSLEGCFECKLRSIPRFVADTYILCDVCDERSETFLNTGTALERPPLGKAPGTLDGAQVETVLSDERHRQTYHKAVLIRQALANYFLGQHFARQKELGVFCLAEFLPYLDAGKESLSDYEP